MVRAVTVVLKNVGRSWVLALLLPWDAAKTREVFVARLAKDETKAPVVLAPECDEEAATIMGVRRLTNEAAIAKQNPMTVRSMSISVQGQKDGAVA